MKTFATLTAAILLATALPSMAAEKDSKDAKSKTKAYPLKTCVVTDEKLGEMGDPFVFAQGDQEIKLCCKSCKKDFDKSPDKFMKKLAKAEKEKK